MAKVKAKGKNSRYDGDLTPEELAQAIALFRAQQGTGNEDEEEEVKLDADEVISQVKERKDRRDSGTEQLDAEEVIAEQESDIEALLKVIDELQAANDIAAADGESDINADEGDPEENLDEGEAEDNADGEDLNQDDERGKALNADSIDKIVKKRLRDYMDVCRTADKLSLDGIENLDLTSARKRVIKKLSPKLNLDGKSDAYIRAAYDIAKQGIAGRKKTDDQRRSMMSGTGKELNTDAADTNSAASAREKMISRMGGKK